MRPRTRKEFEIAIICALPHEADAVIASFDVQYDKYSQVYDKLEGDKNTYTNGRIGQHNVVLCLLPRMGKVNAASATASLLMTYTKIQLALVVGICGAVPVYSDDKVIFLGDVIISDSVIEYDFGSQYPNGFQPKSHIKETAGRHTREIRSLLTLIRTDQEREEFQRKISHHVRSLPRTRWSCPGQTHDMSESSNDHHHIHIGTIASADTVMKSEEHRDKLAKAGVIGFEMEGAGVWDNIPCIIIKGVCDYADSRKNDIWQNYAAAVGASGAKAFLEYLAPNVKQAIDEEDKHCLRALFSTDPEVEKYRIEQSKGGLLERSFHWILKDDLFQKWHDSKANRLLWIKGDAGKGKTMSMIGIIDNLSWQIKPSSQVMNTPIVSYFLCQGTDERLNNGTAILRGLIYRLATEKPSLLPHLRRKYDYSGQRAFENYNSLSLMFIDMLRDPERPAIFLIVDALDECEAELPQLLSLIKQTMSISDPPIKWIVSSRNRNDIEQGLNPINSQEKLSLELNANYISDAISEYVSHKVSQLISLKDHKDTQKQVRDEIIQKADGTFLWASLVIEELQKSFLEMNALSTLRETPAGLTPLYGQMWKKMQSNSRDFQLCLLILSRALLAYRPLHLLEMHLVTGLQEQGRRSEDLEKILNMCSSFFTIREDYIYFIHQSAKDYLINTATTVIFPKGHGKVHHSMFSQSIDAMLKTLRYNIYDLKDPGPIETDFKTEKDTLVSVRYSCIFWIDHFCKADTESLESEQGLADSGRISNFLLKHFLHWLESLSLMHEIPVAIITIRKLLSRIQSICSPYLLAFLQDAERFVLSYSRIIEKSPLQAYGSALGFCPIKSEVKRRYWNDRLSCIKSITGIRENWDACLQRLEGNQFNIRAIKFSRDGKILASVCEKGKIVLWDPNTGALKGTLIDETLVNSISFLSNTHVLASGSRYGTVRLWNTTAKTYEEILRSNEGSIVAMTFSPNGEVLAVALSSGTILLWSIAMRTWEQISNSENSTQRYQSYPNWPWTLSFSSDSQILASVSHDERVWLWYTTDRVWEEIPKNNKRFKFVAFSPVDQTLAILCANHGLLLWDTATRAWKPKIHYGVKGGYLSFSRDGQTVVVASNRKICILSTFRGQKQSFHVSKYETQAIDVSPNGQILALGTFGGEVLLWDVVSRSWEPALENNRSACHDRGPQTRIDLRTKRPKEDLWRIVDVIMSPGNLFLVSRSISELGEIIQLWDPGNMTCKRTFKGPRNEFSRFKFSPDGQTLASATLRGDGKIWDTTTGDCKKIFKSDRPSFVTHFSFSPDSKILAIVLSYKKIQLWDTATWELKATWTDRASSTPEEDLEDCGLFIEALYFSHDRILALYPYDHRVQLWDITTGICTLIVECEGSAGAAAFSLDGLTLAVPSYDLGERLKSSNLSTVRLWDTTTGKEKETIRGGNIRRISFSSDGQYLDTNRGVIPLSVRSRPQGYDHGRDSICFPFVNGQWVTLNEKKIIWLPPEYRSDSCAVYRNKLILACASGVIALEFAIP